MPQFDSSTFASQVFWLTVTFVALYFVLARSVLPKIARVLEARQGRIDDDLERATHLEQEAKEALASIRQVASETARTATRRLIGVEVEAERADEAVAAVARERG